MRYTIILFLFATSAKAQEPTPLQIIDGKVSFEQVITLDSMSAAEIHEKTLNWFGSHFKSAKDVITSNTSSRITARWYAEFCGMMCDDYFTPIIIDIKDGKAKFLITNIEDGLNELLIVRGERWRTQFNPVRIDTEKKINALFRSLEKELKKEAKDW
jgi:hypothetical protein